MSEGTLAVRGQCQRDLSPKALENFPGELPETRGAAVASACSEAAHASEGKEAITSKAEALLPKYIESKRPDAERRAGNREMVAALFRPAAEFTQKIVSAASDQAQSMADDVESTVTDLWGGACLFAGL